MVDFPNNKHGRSVKREVGSERKPVIPQSFHIPDCLDVDPRLEMPGFTLFVKRMHGLSMLAGRAIGAVTGTFFVKCFSFPIRAG
jgi:hypothetical protein